MPEMITKYPDVALKLLNEGEMKCGTDKKPQILITCPKNNFCVSKTGELCVYDIQNIGHATQINAIDIYEITKNVPTILSFWNIALITLIFLLGLWIGAKKKR